MSDVNLEATRLARQVFAKMHGREGAIADAGALTTLAIVLDSAEVTAHEMHDRGVAEEREACAKAAESCEGFDAYGIKDEIADAIRARGK